MVLGLFRRRDRNAAIIERLYLRVAEAARQPAFYRDLQAPDTVEGRFELVTLCTQLAVRRLRALPAPAPDLAQDLVDAVFSHFDAALRELGVGDISVPKRMKTIASAFLGRAKAYEDALGDPDALRAALLRNVWNDAAGREREAGLLADWVGQANACLEKVPFEGFVAGDVPFPALAAAGGTAEEVRR